MQSDRTYNPQNTNFREGVKLKPVHVYMAAVGLCQELDLTCLHVIKNDGQGFHELGRLYQHDHSKKLYLVHYPGKDSDNDKENLTETPLRDIKSQVEIDVMKAFPAIAYDKINQLHFICEVNTYFLVKVDHFIFATYNNSVLTTIDSINREYNLEYIYGSFPGCVRNTIKTGWQNMLLDSWQCGHYVLQVLRMLLRGESLPDNYEITPEIIKYHCNIFTLGKEATSPAPQTSNSEKIIDTFSTDDLPQLHTVNSSEFLDGDNSFEEPSQSMRRPSSIQDLTNFFVVQVDTNNKCDIDSPIFETMGESISFFITWCDTQKNVQTIIDTTESYIGKTSYLFSRDNKSKPEFDSIIRACAKQQILKLDLFNNADNQADEKKAEIDINGMTDYIKSHHGRFKFGATVAYEIYNLFGKGQIEQARAKYIKQDQDLLVRISKLCANEVSESAHKDKLTK